MKKKKIIILSILLTISVFSICSGAITKAKYLSNTAWNYYLKSKGFYFSSDYLSNTERKNTDTSWDGQSVHFNLKNSMNQTLISDDDINYQIICTINGEASLHAACHLNGTNYSVQNGTLFKTETCINNDGIDTSSYNKTECDLHLYEWTKQESVSDLYFDIIATNPNYELNEVSVDITIISTKPYSKTLNGNFYLHKTNVDNGEIKKEYTQYSNYGSLTLSNSYTTNKCLNISWDANQLLIGSNDFISYQSDNNNYINMIKINMEGKSNKSYNYYNKISNIEYGINNFQILEVEC